MSMVVIGSKQDSLWHSTLREAFAPLGAVDIIAMEDVCVKELSGRYEIVAVDAAHVKNVEELVSRLRRARPEQRIVVMTASPTWQRARAAFEAGAADYLPKKLSKAELFKSFSKVRRKQPPPWPR